MTTIFSVVYEIDLSIYSRTIAAEEKRQTMIVKSEIRLYRKLVPRTKKDTPTPAGKGENFHHSPARQLSVRHNRIKRILFEYAIFNNLQTIAVLNPFVTVAFRSN